MFTHQRSTGTESCETEQSSRQNQTIKEEPSPKYEFGQAASQQHGAQHSQGDRCDEKMPAC